MTARVGRGPTAQFVAENRRDVYRAVLSVSADGVKQLLRADRGALAGGRWSAGWRAADLTA